MMKKRLLIAIFVLVLIVGLLTSCDGLPPQIVGPGGNNNTPSGSEPSGDKDSDLNYETIYAYAQELGFEGTIDDLINACKGENAYEIARKNHNYHGTEEEWLQSLIGAAGKDGKNGVTPSIEDNGNWWIGDIDTGVRAEGKDGIDGVDGKDGIGIENISLSSDGCLSIVLTDGSRIELGNIRGEVGANGQDGQNGQDGKNGVSPSIGDNGNWWIGDIDTGVQVAGYGFDYIELDDGNFYVSVGTRTRLSRLNIPESFNGQHIIGIEEEGFLASKALTEITLTPSIKWIGKNAFPDTLTKVVFNGTCKEWSEVLIEEPNEALRNAEIVLTTSHNYVDGFCTICENYTLENNTLIIEKQDSDYVVIEIKSKDYTEIIVPYYITRIDANVFNECNNIESLVIPFIGASKDGTKNTHFGYIFGASSYNDNNDYVPSSLKTVIITGGTSIGERAFSDCSGLTSITIPDSVKSIGYYAFYDCSGLTSVIIGNGVTSIGDGAFACCSGLTNIIIGSSFVNIGEYSFFDCCKLRHIAVSEDNPSYSSQDGILYNKNKTTIILIPKNIQGSVIIPDGITNIRDYAFYECNGLTRITIPDSVTSIGNYAFSHCSELDSITVSEGNSVYHSDGNCLIETATKTLILGCKNSIIPTDGSVTSIDNSAFRGCIALTSITIPDSVTSIGYYAFYNCSGLTNVSIGNSVISIGDQAFYNCSGLTSITIPDSVTSIGSEAFSDCSGLASITIGNGVTNIGYDAFKGTIWYENQPDEVIIYVGNVAYSYKGKKSYNNSITLKDGTLGIASRAFSGHRNLADIIIPDSVTNIGTEAFYGCRSLTDIIIPDSVTSIGKEAFYGCRSLTDITFGNNIAYIGQDAFDDTAWYDNQPDGLVYVSKVAYKYKGTMTNNTSISIKEGIASITDSAFSDYAELINITIPDSVTSIGNEAFSGCYKLIEVYNLSSLDIRVGNTDNGHVGYYALDVYTSLDTPSKLSTTDDGYIIRTDSDEKILLGYTGNKTELTLPDDITSIYQYAFNGITSITIPDSVTSIAEYAFYYCRGLASITVSEDNPNYSSQDGILYNKDKTAIILIPKNIQGSVIIPDGITSIGGSAFSGCSGLTSITIPDSITSIGDSAFSHCSGLTSITIPDSVTSIGDSAFEYCSGLTSITIGNGVTHISFGAFVWCSGLTSIIIGKSVTIIDASAFYCGQFGSFDEIIIDSSEIAKLDSFRGYLLNYAKTVYVKDGLTVGSYITDSFTLSASSDMDGYVMYVK